MIIIEDWDNSKQEVIEFKLESVNVLTISYDRGRLEIHTETGLIHKDFSGMSDFMISFDNTEKEE